MAFSCLADERLWSQPKNVCCLQLLEVEVKLNYDTSDCSSTLWWNSEEEGELSLFLLLYSCFIES